MMMWYGMDGWGWGGWILMTLVMVVFWAAVITAIALAVRYLTTGHGTEHPTGSDMSWPAEGVLTERFARGEIDEDEFRRRMTLLREHR